MFGTKQIGDVGSPKETKHQGFSFGNEELVTADREFSIRWMKGRVLHLPPAGRSFNIVAPPPSKVPDDTR